MDEYNKSQCIDKSKDSIAEVNEKIGGFQSKHLVEERKVKLVILTVYVSFVLALFRDLSKEVIVHHLLLVELPAG